MHYVKGSHLYIILEYEKECGYWLLIWKVSMHSLFFLLMLLLDFIGVVIYTKQYIFFKLELGVFETYKQKLIVS